MFSVQHLETYTINANLTGNRILICWMVGMPFPALTLSALHATGRQYRYSIYSQGSYLSFNAFTAHYLFSYKYISRASLTV